MCYRITNPVKPFYYFRLCLSHMSIFAGSFPADIEMGALTQQQGVPGVPPPVPPPPTTTDYYKPKESRSGEEVSPLVKPTEGGLWAQVSWGITVPIHALCRATIPDCKKERWRHWYPFTFLMSMIWISFYSYIMVWMITVIGEKVFCHKYS
jgi:hypothetical protein